MKIGILGGSFNPAHQGHLYIAKQAIKKFALNQVWLIPTWQNPFKTKELAESYKSRLSTCLEIKKNQPKIYVKDFQKDSISTYKLIKKIKKQYPNARFYWIMGADNMEKFHLWKNFISLIKNIEFLVFSRNDSFAKARNSKAFLLYKKIIKKNNLPKISLIKIKNYDISSTKLRNNR